MNNDKPIRILHVVQKMEAAGLQSFIMNIYRKINREEVQFDFLTHYTREQFYDKEIEDLGGRIYRLSVREDKNFLKYIADLKKFFSMHTEYRIVHGHMDSLGYFYLGAAKRAGVPIRIAHAHTVLNGGDFLKRLRTIINRLYKINATKLLACSEEAGKYMFGASEFEVIHNPIEVEQFAFNERIRQEVRKELNVENNLVIGHVGRFSAPKNHKFLLDIFKNIVAKRSNAVLLLVGTGELFDDIKHYGKTIGIAPCIKYLGVRGDVQRIYQAMDAFIFPSLWEGLGLVAIEAQASGLPTICSDKVPELAKATDLFCRLPLNLSSKNWADIVISLTEKNTRTDHSVELIENGYDVSDVEKEIICMYNKSILRGGGNNVIFIFACISANRIAFANFHSSNKRRVAA